VGYRGCKKGRTVLSTPSVRPSLVVDLRDVLTSPLQDRLRKRRSKPSFSLVPGIANFSFSTTPPRRSLMPFPLLRHCPARSPSFIRRQVPTTSLIIGTREASRSAPTSSRTGYRMSTPTQQATTPKRTRWILSCVRTVSACPEKKKHQPHVFI